MTYATKARNANAAPADQADPVPRPKSSLAAIGIFIILLFGVATLARSFLMPLCLGILLFLVFSPVSRWLAKRQVPEVLSAAFITLSLAIGFVLAAALLAVPLSSAVENAPSILERLSARLEALRGPFQAVQDGLTRLGNIGPDTSGGGGTSDVAPNATGMLTSIASWTPAVFGQIVFTLVLLFFMLATREILYKRIIESLPTFHDKKHALGAIQEIERSLGHYLGTITIINATLGVVIGLAMWILGMPTPALFGVMAFAFNYVPYLGALAGVVVAMIVALIALDEFLALFMVGAVYFSLTAVEGQIITPYFVSQRLQLNTVVVFIAVALFAWLWSVVGMIVAVPMLVVFNVICAHVPGLRGFGAFLSGADD